MGNEILRLLKIYEKLVSGSQGVGFSVLFVCLFGCGPALAEKEKKKPRWQTSHR